MSLQFSWISLIIIIIVGILVSLDQGQTIFIQLLHHSPFNFFAFVVLSYGLAKILSHYPEYVDIWVVSRTEPKRYLWQMDYSELAPWMRIPLEWVKNNLGLGFITYGIHQKSPRQWDFKYTVNNYIRRGLGIMVFFFIYFLAFSTLRINQLLKPSLCAFLPWLLGMSLCAFHVIAQINYRYWKLWHVRAIFYSSTACLVLSSILVYNLGWSRSTVWFFIITWTLLAVRFIIFRAVPRKVYQASTHPIDVFYTWKNYTSYVMQISVYGFVSVILIIIAHFYVQHISALVIILSYLILLYGIIILPIKGFLYHRFHYLYGRNACRFYIWGIPFISISLCVAAFFLSNQDNSLHRLSFVPKSVEPLRLDDFIQDAQTYFDDTSSIYYIASYGGGLKANAWNLLVLDALYQKGILSQTMALSGVSGGSLGQAVYTAILKNYPDTSSRTQVIQDLAVRDYLAVDAAYFAGGDFIREFLPDGPWMNGDRAKRSMDLYALAIGDATLNEKGFRYYWLEHFKTLRSRADWYPMILSNSTGTHEERGIVSSLDMSGAFDQIFPASTDILSGHGNQVIPFLYATSCSNRFPIFSPAARVEEKGHFVDGGYFENSGLLSLLDVHNHLTSNGASFQDSQSVFIQIVNDKTSYVRYVVDKWLLVPEETPINPFLEVHTELSAITKTITSIEQMPRYVNAWVRNTYPNKVIEIHLPYRISKKDIESVYDIAIDELFLKEQIEKHNTQLDSMLTSAIENNYEIAEPPLARILGPQAFRYMEILAPIMVEKEKL